MVIVLNIILIIPSFLKTSKEVISTTIPKHWNEIPQNTEISIANTKPSLLLQGEKPRLIDEWQIAPTLWNAVRYSVDNINKPGQYILTGSATAYVDSTMHSGVGRFSIVKMKPMSLYESGDSNGKISLNDLFLHKAKIDGITTDLDYEKNCVFSLSRRMAKFY